MFVHKGIGNGPVKRVVSIIIAQAFLITNIGFADLGPRNADTVAAYYASELTNEKKDAKRSLADEVAAVDNRTAEDRTQQLENAWRTIAAMLLVRKIAAQARAVGLRGVTSLHIQREAEMRLAQGCRAYGVPQSELSARIDAARSLGERARSAVRASPSGTATHGDARERQSTSGAVTATFAINGILLSQVPIVKNSLRETIASLALNPDILLAQGLSGGPYVLVNGRVPQGDTLDDNDSVTVTYRSPLASLKRHDNPNGQDFYRDNYPLSTLQIIALSAVSGMMGITTNLSIFQKCASQGQFDTAIRAEVADGRTDAGEVYDKVTMPAFQRYTVLIGLATSEAAGNPQGTASYEVPPQYIHDVETTARYQKEITALNPFVTMVKTPSTAAGFEAIRRNAATPRVVRDNLTLMFGFDQWVESQLVQIEKLEARVAAGLPVDTYFGVDSFFLSRTDILLYTLFEKLKASGVLQGEDAEQWELIKDLVAVAQAKIVGRWNNYVYFGKGLPEGTPMHPRLAELRARFEALNGTAKTKGLGAIRPRVPLWASTMVKEPDVKRGVDALLYFVNLIGTNTVNTMPDGLIDAIENRFKGMSDVEKGAAIARLDNAIDDNRIITKYNPQGQCTYAHGGLTPQQIIDAANALLAKHTEAILGMQGTHPSDKGVDIRTEVANYNRRLESLVTSGTLSPELCEQERLDVNAAGFACDLEALAKILTWRGGDLFEADYRKSLAAFEAKIGEIRQSPSGTATHGDTRERQSTTGEAKIDRMYDIYTVTVPSGASFHAASPQEFADKLSRQAGIGAITGPGETVIFPDGKRVGFDDIAGLEAAINKHSGIGVRLSTSGRAETLKVPAPPKGNVRLTIDQGLTLLHKLIPPGQTGNLPVVRSAYALFTRPPQAVKNAEGKIFIRQTPEEAWRPLQVARESYFMVEETGDVTLIEFPVTEPGDKDTLTNLRRTLRQGTVEEMFASSAPRGSTSGTAQEAPSIVVAGSIVADVIVTIGEGSEFPLPAEDLRAHLAYQEDKEFKTPDRKYTDAYLSGLSPELKGKLGVTYGGPAFASAMVLHELGAKVKLICAVGDDEFGRRAIEFMRSKGMDTSGVKVVKGVSTSTNLIFSNKDTGTTAYNLALGSANEYLEAKDVMQGMTEASVLHLGGIAITPKLMDEVEDLVGWAKERGLKVGWDTVVDLYGKEKSEAARRAMSKLDYITPSIKEAKLITGRSEPGANLLYFSQLGIPAVFLKNGEEGSEVLTIGENVFGATVSFHIPAVKVTKEDFVDGTGAGDSYSAYIAYAVAKGMSPVEAAKGASVCGALTVQRRGGGSISRKGEDPARAFQTEMQVFEGQLKAGDGVRHSTTGTVPSVSDAIDEVRDLTAQMSLSLAQKGVDMGLSDKAVIINAGLCESANQDLGSRSDTLGLPQKYRVMEQGLGRTFEGSVVRVRTQEELAHKVNELRHEGKNVIVLDDGSLVKGLDHAGIDDVKDTNYCVVQTGELQAIDTQTNIRFVNLYAMAMVGVAILDENESLFTHAYRAFTGEAPEAGLLQKVRNLAQWIISILPRPVKLDYRNREEQDLQALFKVAA